MEVVIKLLNIVLNKTKIPVFQIIHPRLGICAEGAQNDWQVACMFIKLKSRSTFFIYQIYDDLKSELVEFAEKR